MLSSISHKTSSILLCLIVIAGLLTVNFIFTKRSPLLRRGDEKKSLNASLNPTPTAEAANNISLNSASSENERVYGTTVLNNSSALNSSSPVFKPISSASSNNAANDN